MLVRPELNSQPPAWQSSAQPTESIGAQCKTINLYGDIIAFHVLIMQLLVFKTAILESIKTLNEVRKKQPEEIGLHHQDCEYAIVMTVFDWLSVIVRFFQCRGPQKIQLLSCHIHVQEIVKSINFDYVRKSLSLLQWTVVCRHQQ